MLQSVKNTGFNEKWDSERVISIAEETTCTTTRVKTRNTIIYTGTYISIRNEIVWFVIRHLHVVVVVVFSINPVSSTGSTTTVLPVVAYHHHHHWFVRPRRSCYFCIGGSGSGWHLPLSFSSRTSAWEGRNVPQPRWDVAFHNFGYQIQHRP